jgi:hypothetical protein
MMNSAWGEPLDRTPATDQVVYQDDHRYDHQDVNQVATDVTEESQ